MTLTSDEVARRVRNAAITVDEFDPAHEHAPHWIPGYEVLFTRIESVLTRYPHLVDRFGYAWAADKSAYRSCMDVIFQHNVLELLADVDQGHPDLVGLKPVAARMAVNRDFISYSRPGTDLDFVFVSRGFMNLLKYFLELTVEIMALGPPVKRAPAPWGPFNLREICRRSPEEVIKALRDFVDRALAIVRGDLPPPHYPIQTSLAATGNFTMFTYDAVESFVVAHELGHLLGRHDLSDDSVAKEIAADRTALSLQLARSGTQATVDGTGIAATLGVYLGGPAFYFVGGIYYLIAALSEFARGRSPAPHLETVDQLQMRWVAYRHFQSEFKVLSSNADRYCKGIFDMASLVAEAVNRFTETLTHQVASKAVPLVPEDYYGRFWTLRNMKASPTQQDRPRSAQKRQQKRRRRK